MYRILMILLFCSTLVEGQDLIGQAPLKVYEDGQISVKSYNFNGLEPIFNKTDETIYVINFWATWCLPCVKELPYFEQLNEKYKDKNVKVILVSMDMPKKVETALLPFIKKKNLKSEIIHLDDPDANAWIEKVDKNWSGAIPATVIYNAKTRKFYEQSFTYEELEKEVLTIINN
ncbi:TlpA disulfide reductase family protein [Flavobacterium sp.]|uniref:TlpA disulfide reductase family protein n=1 Tax=Flavobacterium sp. TaxID=239 RepID=UPI0028BE08A4|nr:TlpA disulfide reductase family protein [Flavobacterium sp.]